ncbi:RNA polymerase sigma factor [Maritimibacter sp. HL-12]|uniref:RNA polymerase sigma factor n=1 Tax=Maritimibacter sp. HL-12 TaxID=1162418 RepID=UPI000A0EEF82|nr:RNA polymerase sigma factor [Maritimibacter sp. HL-12]SMH53276.1 RNA polymerase sigma-70 factor, ECF subfamily [Maritimibacter sp. HL-12]
MTHAPPDWDPREALVELLPALRAFALSLSRNSATADDLVQETVLKAWSNLDKFEAGTNFKSWLFTILRNTYYSTLRKYHREVADVDGIHAAGLAQKPDHDGRLALDDFGEAFTQLPDEQREVLILIAISGFSYEEAAETCGCAVGTIKSRANRARKRLAELLELDAGEELEMTDQATMAVVSAQNDPAR